MADWARAATVTLYYDGQKVGEGRVDSTEPMVFSADETTDVGRDSEHARQRRLHPRRQRFTGKISWVQIDIGKDGHDHLITPEERLNLAMARQ